MKKFQIIIADPPWSFQDTLTMSNVPRGAEANYQLMSNEDIKNLPIKDISDPDGCILALWVPSSLLQTGLDTMKAWGFEHKQTYIWVKTKKIALSDLTSVVKPKGVTNNNYKDYIKQVINLVKSANMNAILAFGMGRLFRQTHEVALIGINNKKIYKSLQNKSQRSVSFAPNLKHSSKPNDLHFSLDKMFPSVNNKLELFARRLMDGWTCLGNEVCGGEDIRDSIAKL